MTSVNKSLAQGLGLSLLLFVVAVLPKAAHAGTVTDLCMNIANYSGESGGQCAQLVGNHTFDPAAVDVCTQVLQNSVSGSLNCIKAVADKHYDAQALPVCSSIAAYDGDQAVACVTAAGNKTYPNGTALICARIVQDSISQAVNCMQNTGVAYAAPVPPPVFTQPNTCPTTPNVIRGVSASIDSIDRYDTLSARKILLTLLSQLSTCHK